MIVTRRLESRHARTAVALVLALQVPSLGAGCAMRQPLILPADEETLARANRDLANRDVRLQLLDGSSDLRSVDSLRPDSVRVGGEDSPSPLPLASVRSLSVRSSREGGRLGAELGFAAGLAVGIGIGLAGELQDDCILENCQPGDDERIPVRVGKGAVLGSALGLAAGLVGWPIGRIVGRTVVYEVSQEE